MIQKTAILKNVRKGKNVTVWHYCNLYHCFLGDNVMIGSFVEIQGSVRIGNNTRIQSHSFICSLVSIGENCFIGHGVMFINDKKPMQAKDSWKPTHIGDNTVIGSNATILPVSIGKNCLIGAGSVVTKDIPDNCVAYGNPAVIKKRFNVQVERLLI